MSRWFGIIVLIGLMLTATPVLAGSAGDNLIDRSLISIAADNIEVVFGHMAAGVRALGQEYAALDRALPPADRMKDWTAKRVVKDKTALYQTWPGDLTSPPASQADLATFYSYTGAELSRETVRQFEIFSALTPAFRSAYRTFNFSWVYLTTVTDAMMIYPFLPLDHGVDNYPPRKHIFYTCANFEKRAPGWSPPYLDLAGMGLMITVSCPIYQGDKLLGVASQDITLKQLSDRVLKSLAAYPQSIALLVDGWGLAIGASRTDLAAELDRINTAAGGAVLHYRTPAGLKKLADEKAQASGSERINNVVEKVLARVGATRDIQRFAVGRDMVLSAPIRGAGWFLVLVRPN